MRKTSIVLQYLIVFGLAGFMLYTIFRPVPVPVTDRENWSNWEGFSVISFAGIDRKNSDDYVTRDRMKEQLLALHQAGYTTVTPDEILRFLEGRAPLPDKALLVLFEGGRKEAMIRATPLLEELGMRATMLVPTMYTKQWGNFFLKKNEIRKVSAMPHWSIGSMGHEAAIDIKTDASTPPGRFLTTRRVQTEGLETDNQFAARVMDDYAESRRILAEATGWSPLLYVYPFADTGSGPGAEPSAAELNRTGVTSHYAMAITRADHSFNGSDSDPFALARLRTSGNWSGEDLIARLERDQPRHVTYKGPSTEDSWLQDFDPLISSAEILLKPRSAVWLRGTENWDDVDAEAMVSGPGDGALIALYARHNGPRSFVRLTLSDRELVLQEQLPAGIQALARVPVSISAGQPSSIRLRIRNNRAWIFLNGQEAGRSLPLAKTTRRGRVGLGADLALARVSQFTARPLPAHLVEAEQPGLASGADRDDIKSILSPWEGEIRRDELAMKYRAGVLQSSAAGLDIIPVTSTSADEARRLVDWLRSENLLTLVHSVAVHALDAEIAGILRDAGIQPLFMVDDSQPVAASDWMVKHGADGALLIRPSGDAGQVPVKAMSRILPAHRIFVFSSSLGAYVPAHEIGLNGSGG